MRMKLLSIAALLTVALAFSVSAQTSDRETGFEYFQAGDFVLAIESFKKAVQADTNDLPSLLYLSFSQFKNGDRASALITARKWSESRDNGEAKYKFFETNYKIKRKVGARQPKSSGRDFFNAKARLFVELKKDGKIGKIFIVDNNFAGWDEQLFDAARGIRFKPAQKNGIAVTSVIPVDYSFEGLE